jgi:tRNA dimethylallyltransferase
MQVYRGMDVGTAKTPPEARLVPHHCVDLVDPGTAYSAALYQRDSRAAIDRVLSAGRLPVVVGGTGLYVRAALDRFEFPLGELAHPTRHALERLAAEIGPEELYERLRQADPAAAALIHPNNVRRVIRALEMLEAGASYADQAAGFTQREPFYEGTLFVGLTMERAVLYRRIDERVDAMIAAGLLDEVRRLLAEGYRSALTAAQAIGYKELVPVVEGAAGLDEAIERIKRATRRYAKRQLTWFRADPRVRWVDVTDRPLSDTVAAVLDLVESADRR